MKKDLKTKAFAQRTAYKPETSLDSGWMFMKPCQNVL